MSRANRLSVLLSSAALLGFAAALPHAAHAQASGPTMPVPSSLPTLTGFTPGDLVVSTVTTTTTVGALDTASPITLVEMGLSKNGQTATATNSLELPQTSGPNGNNPISGEYGSASEGALELSANGEVLTIGGYGVNANTFNNAPLSTYGTNALGQTISVANGTNTVVPRVAAVISADGQVNTSTAITGVFNTNNIRSVATVNGNTLYISGQGASKTDPTQGLFVAQEGATTATPIYNTTDTRIVEIYDGQLYVSQDYNPPGSGAQNDTSVSGVGSGLPTGASSLTHITPPASPYSSGGNNGSINLTTSLKNNVNASRVGSFVYLSPESYFFASPDVLYVADSGQPKNGNANKAALGEGGLQKWVLDPTTGVWSLAYDIYLDLSPNLDGVDNNANANSNAPTDPGVTGLYGLTGEVVDGQVELFATSYGLNELSPSYLYEITDTLSNINATIGSAEEFTTLYEASAGTEIRGVAFAPVPEPATLALLGTGLAGLAAAYRRRRR